MRLDAFPYEGEGAAQSLPFQGSPGREKASLQREAFGHVSFARYLAT